MGIGPSTKETSLHHFRDPLVDVLSNDRDIDFQGIIVVGTPQDNRQKHLVGMRTAIWLQAMRTDGVIISSDGWGNSDVDYANTMEEIGDRGISIVGLKFMGKHKFVVENQYTKYVLDFNKSKEGIETEVVCQNNIENIDARKVLALLKLKMREDRNNKK